MLGWSGSIHLKQGRLLVLLNYKLDAVLQHGCLHFYEKRKRLSLNVFDVLAEPEPKAQAGVTLGGNVALSKSTVQMLGAL